MLLLISGIHGVEGFCGSGCQVGFFVDRLYGAFPSTTGVVAVHAVNPFGFAWLRRTNEDNIDLNRNFQDFSQPLPSSEAYEAVHDWLIPEYWEGASREAADAAIQHYIASRGLRTLQSAVSSGQYSRPIGLFYGGTRPSWSNVIFRQILLNHVPSTVRKIATLDFHTGLGPSGYGEPIFIGPGDEGFERAKEWYGPEVTSVPLNTSTSTNITGSLADAFQELSVRAEVTCLSLEFGTLPMLDVLTALRADHWLHAIPNRNTILREGIMRQIRGAFFIDRPE